MPALKYYCYKNATSFHLVCILLLIYSCFAIICIYCNHFTGRHMHSCKYSGTPESSGRKPSEGNPENKNFQYNCHPSRHFSQENHRQSWELYNIPVSWGVLASNQILRPRPLDRGTHLVLTG
jgi:hypothetical protein